VDTDRSSPVRSEPEAIDLRRLVPGIEDRADAVTVQDLAGRIVGWSRGAERLYGFPRSEALQLTCDALIPEEGRALAHGLLEAVGRGEDVAPAEASRLTRDGRMLRVWLTPARVVDDRGRAVGVATEELDITDREQALEALREISRMERGSSALLRTITSNIPDPVFVKDDQGRFLFVNPAALDVIGRPADQVLGRSDRDFFEDPSVAAALAENDRRIIQSGQPEVFEEHIQTPRGGRHFLTTKAPVRDATGKVTGIVGVARDITERKQAEEALRESEERLVALVAASSDVVYRMSPDWREMRDLRGRGFIADTGAPTRSWLEKYIHPDDQPLVLATIAEAIRTRSTFQLEHRVLRVNGSLGWTFSRAIPIVDDSGVILEWFGAAADITSRKRAEEALRQSEERLRLLIQGVKDCAIFMLAPDGTVSSWNAGAEKIFGYREEEIVGQPRGLLFGEVDRNAGEPQRSLEEAASTGRGEQDGWRVRKDGSRLWANVLLTALRDEAGNLRGFATVTRDFTDRKRAEELHAQESALREARERELAAERAVREASEGWASQLEQANGRLIAAAAAAAEAGERESRARAEAERREQELRALFGSMRDAVLVYGEDGRVRTTNEAAAALFGMDLRGLTMAELIRRFDIRALDEAGVAGGLVAEDRLPGKRAFRGEVVSGARMRLRTPAGLRSLLVSASPLYPGDAAQGALSLVLDVTDYERAVEAARRAAEQLRLSHDAIFVWQFHGGIESWNRGAEDLYGFGSEEARGRSPQELLRTRFQRSWKELEGELIRRRRWEGELVQTTQDGHMVIVSAKLQLIRHEDGVERVLEVNRDITDRKRAEDALRESEQQLREADRRKDEFLAVLSHELRNPLAPIRNSLFVLDRAPRGGEQERRAKTIIERQVNQLARLVADLLDVSRITRGKVLLQRERIDLREVVQRTLEDHRSLYASRGVVLRAEQPGGPLWVDGDPARLAQVLTNLLHNAAKYTMEGGEVVVVLGREGDWALLEVRDTGAGIPPDMLGRVFEPFSQGEQALDRSAGGLGLGLALVKGLVELHGGDVTARSEGAGKGAAFTLRIPAVAAPAPAPRPELKLVKPRARRVLVIEDNVDAAESLKEALELEEHEVALAFSGPEGLEKARAFMPELVLCDIGLPGMDGYDVARGFRGDAHLRDIPLVAMTGYALSEDQRKAAEAGFDRHLAKPADLGTLERILVELAERQAR
jgi:two-component system CheB/CheR fusion protein